MYQHKHFNVNRKKKTLFEIVNWQKQQQKIVNKHNSLDRNAESTKTRFE